MPERHEDEQSFERYFAAIEVQIIPVTTLKTPPFRSDFFPIVEEILTFHGAKIVKEGDHCEITFPEGTVKSEILPRIYSEKYRIVFPDKYEVRETKRRGEQYSFLQFDGNTLSTKQQKALKK